MEKCKPFPINDILLHIGCNECIKEGYYSDSCESCPELLEEECCYFTPYLNLKKCQECSEFNDVEDPCKYARNYQMSPDMCKIDVPFDECYEDDWEDESYLDERQYGWR